MNAGSWLCAILFAMFALAGAAGQSRASSSDVFLQRLQGEWRGEGTFSKARAQSRATWEPVLDGKFFRFTVQISVTESGSTPSFAGHGYYQAKGEGFYEGYWFDNEGHQYPIKAGLVGDTLTAFWGIPGKIEGKSVYTLTDSGRGFEIVDSFKAKDGTWRELNRFTLRRA